MEVDPATSQHEQPKTQEKVEGDKDNLSLLLQGEGLICVIFFYNIYLLWGVSLTFFLPWSDD